MSEQTMHHYVIGDLVSPERDPARIGEVKRVSRAESWAEVQYPDRDAAKREPTHDLRPAGYEMRKETLANIYYDQFEEFRDALHRADQDLGRLTSQGGKIEIRRRRDNALLWIRTHNMQSGQLTQAGKWTLEREGGRLTWRWC